MNKFFTSLLLICLSLVILPANAHWVKATGMAMIEHNDLVQARRAAIRDALRQASFQGALRVNGYQSMKDGELLIDQVAISTQSSIGEMEILDEEVKNGLMYVTVNAFIEASGSCKGGNFNNGYQRSLAISNFFLEKPLSANMGALHNVNDALPREILQRMQSDDKIRVLDAVNFQFFDDAQSLPTSVNSQGQLTTAVDAATRLGSQYVLTGIIRSLDLLNPELAGARTPLQSLYERTKYKGKRFARELKLDIFIHDGFSGELVTSRSYITLGNWTENRTAKLGFASPAFWKTDYGQQVDALIEQLITDLNVQVGCQPFMARITRTDGKNLYIDTGSAAGLRPGDNLEVYRVNTFYDQQQREYTELVPAQLNLVLERVQSNFAQGSLTALPAVANIQVGDVVIAW